MGTVVGVRGEPRGTGLLIHRYLHLHYLLVLKARKLANKRMYTLATWFLNFPGGIDELKAQRLSRYAPWIGNS